MEAIVSFRPDKFMQQIMIFDGNRRVWDFVERDFKEFKLGQFLGDGAEFGNCILYLPTEVYKALAVTIQGDKTIPAPDKSYLEGKVEIMERYVRDLRKVAKIT